MLRYEEVCWAKIDFWSVLNYPVPLREGSAFLFPREWMQDTIHKDFSFVKHLKQNFNCFNSILFYTVYFLHGFFPLSYCNFTIFS